MRATIIALALLAASPCAAKPDERQVRRDCTADALRYCRHAIPQGRAAIITCMLSHRDKLQPNCTRHFY